MIPANDLRIGNLVTVNNPKYHPKLKDVILQVISIDELLDFDKIATHAIRLKHINQEPNTYYETYSQFIKFIELIPLSEDILLKCGFISNPYQDRYESKWCNVECDKTKGITELWIESHPHIKYLHQLQNLIWINFNEELKVNI